MKTHRSAKTNEYQRRLLISRVRRRRWSYRRAAEAAGVSVRTVAKWLTRARTDLRDRSSRPHRQPRRTPAKLEASIVALRRTRATAWQISAALKVPRSTVTRILARAGLNRLSLLEVAQPVRRYEWPHAGDLLHVDLKRLGRIAGIGHRIHGDRRARARAGSAGSFCRSRSTMPRDSPTSKSWPPIPATPVRPFCAARSPGIVSGASASDAS